MWDQSNPMAVKGGEGISIGDSIFLKKQRNARFLFDRDDGGTVGDARPEKRFGGNPALEAFLGKNSEDKNEGFYKKRTLCVRMGLFVELGGITALLS